MRISFYLGLACLLLGNTAAASETGPTLHKITPASWVYRVEGDYQDVKSDLVTAIESRGIVVSYVAHAASMLQRTAAAVGAIGKAFDFADILLFCKADLTYTLTIKDPHNISLCPYSISIYTLPTDWKHVYLSIRAPSPDIPAYEPVHQLLIEIITETLAW